MARKYDHEYKVQAIKPAKETDGTKESDIKASVGKLYISAPFGCFDPDVFGPATETNIKESVCPNPVKYPNCIPGAGRSYYPQRPRNAVYL